MRAFGPGHPLVFSHIPKTAGTSMRAALAQCLQPTLTVDGRDLALVGVDVDFDKVTPAIRSGFYFDPGALPAEADLVVGHISPGTTMARYPDAEHITFLRNPQARVISQWMHGRSLSDFDLRHWGPGAVVFRDARLPLRDYLHARGTAPNIDNCIARFLVWPHPLVSRGDFIDEGDDEKVLAAAIERLGSFAHVDVVENPSFMADLGAWLGRQLPLTRLNERTSMPPKMRPDLSEELDPATMELLAHRNRIDTRIWEHVARRVLPDADLDQVLDAALQKSIDRYTAALNDPGQSRPVKRAVEHVYALGHRARTRLTR